MDQINISKKFVYLYAGLNKKEEKGDRMKRKDTILLLIFGLIFSFGLGYIVFGKRGIISYYKLKKEIDLEKQQIQHLKEEIAHIQAKIDLWKSDEFHAEKFARQDLQMGKPDEQVFVLTNTNKKT